MPAAALHKCLLGSLTARRDHVTGLTYVVCAWVNTLHDDETPHIACLRMYPCCCLKHD